MIRSESLRVALLVLALATPAWATEALDPDFIGFLADNTADLAGSSADSDSTLTYMINSDTTPDSAWTLGVSLQTP